MKKILFLSIIFALLLVTVAFAQDYTFATYAAKPYEGQIINVAMVAEPRSDAVKKLLPEFEQLTGIKVNLEILPYPTLQENKPSPLPGTGVYDVVHVDCVWVGQYAGQGLVIPVDEYIQKLIKVLAIDDFIPSVLDEQGSWEGKIYGLPFIQAVFTCIIAN